MKAPAPYRIRLAEDADVAPWRAYLQRTMDDNGRDGAYFAPFAREDHASRFTPQKLAETRDALARPLTEPGWRRGFLVLDEAQAIVGSADLNGGSLRSDLHRCNLGIGLSRPHQGKGLGEALLRATIDWAKDAGLRYMDLGVFAGNTRAEALYRKVGFVERGRVPDRFRLGDVSLEDVMMTLDLHAPA